ncbi:hypothetical protein MASR2M69_02860 [Bacteroidota bacterium]
MARTISSSPVVIEVIKGDGTAKKSENERTTAGVSSDDIFLRLSLSKTRVVKGEHLIATLKIYTKFPLQVLKMYVFRHLTDSGVRRLKHRKI